VTPHLIGYIAAVVDRRSRPNWSPIYFVWKSRLLSSEKDAQSVLSQWEQTMSGLFQGCTREVLPIYIDVAAGVQGTRTADKGEAFREWQQDPLYPKGSTDTAALTNFDAGYMRGRADAAGVMVRTEEPGP
jgi:hypothetical protein